ncbi:GDP-mannose 4,6-dehydratase [Candidatus Woesearchaeota archaeon]|nr:GDP-mannose 4,6-dehydratase [Candidatus Woesearchaeota archaeon]
MKCLITGGAGFIGSHLCKALLAKGNKVIAVDNFNGYYNPRIKEANLDEIRSNPLFKLYRSDILDYKKLQDIFENEKPDKVVHLAARAGVRASLENPLLYQKVNIKGTNLMLEIAKKYAIKKFIFGSSSSVYGINKKVPFSEDDLTDKQISPYGITKKSGELLCRCYNSLYGIPIVCLRFFTVYGPHGRPDMAPYKFTKLILEGKPIEVYGGGGSKRDYTYVQDIIAGILLALDSNLNFEIINLGNSNTVELGYLISLIEKETGKKAMINKVGVQKGDVPITYADISKAKRLLGYDPKVKIEKGISLFVDWFKNK